MSESGATISRSSDDGTPARPAYALSSQWPFGSGGYHPSQPAPLQAVQTQPKSPVASLSSALAVIHSDDRDRDRASSSGSGSSTAALPSALASTTTAAASVAEGHRQSQAMADLCGGDWESLEYEDAPAQAQPAYFDAVVVAADADASSSSKKRKGNKNNNHNNHNNNNNTNNSTNKTAAVKVGKSAKDSDKDPAKGRSANSSKSENHTQPAAATATATINEELQRIEAQFLDQFQDAPHLLSASAAHGSTDRISRTSPTKSYSSPSNSRANAHSGAGTPPPQPAPAADPLKPRKRDSARPSTRLVMAPTRSGSSESADVPISAPPQLQSRAPILPPRRQLAQIESNPDGRDGFPRESFAPIDAADAMEEPASHQLASTEEQAPDAPSKRSTLRRSSMSTASEFVLLSGARKLTVLTYNVNWGFCRMGIASQKVVQIAHGIRTSGADIVCLQETHHGWEQFLRSSLRDIYPHMIFRHHDTVLPESNSVSSAGGQGFLSVHPLHELWYEQPPVAGSFFPGWMVELVVEGQPVQVLNVHLRPPISNVHKPSFRALFQTSSIRRAELQFFYDRMKPKPGSAIIVAGDFNEGHDGAAVVWLKGGRGKEPLNDSLIEFQPSCKTWKWPLRFGLSLKGAYDHIMYSPETIRALNCRVMSEYELLSDHIPVVAEFALLESRPGGTQPAEAEQTQPSAPPLLTHAVDHPATVHPHDKADASLHVPGAQNVPGSSHSGHSPSALSPFLASFPQSPFRALLHHKFHTPSPVASRGAFFEGLAPLAIPAAQEYSLDESLADDDGGTPQLHIPTSEGSLRRIASEGALESALFSAMQDSAHPGDFEGAHQDPFGPVILPSRRSGSDWRIARPSTTDASLKPSKQTYTQTPASSSTGSSAPDSQSRKNKTDVISNLEVF